MGNRRSIFLYPFSVIWGIISGFRNFLYDKKILDSRKFDLPVICTGNITVGGTGKTPHAGYLAGLLGTKYNVAVLSRGYKRKTKGFRLAGPASETADIGDEPLLISRKYPGITVAVDSDRRSGITRILEERPGTDVIILDDGFQHRRITPGLSILLSDYDRPMYRDYLLPFGNLRESLKNIKRADIIIITKTPADITAEDQKSTMTNLGLTPDTKLFFSSLVYGDPVPVFNGNIHPDPSFSDPGNGILLVTGLGNPAPLYDHLRKSYKKVMHLRFGDHHYFSPGDIAKIQNTMNDRKRELKYIITTEKDAVRLRELDCIREPLLSSLYYIPVEIDFLNNRKEEFNKLITDYVGENLRNN